MHCNYKDIEQKWQKVWQSDKSFSVQKSDNKRNIMY